MHSRLLRLARDTRLSLLLTVLSGFLAGLLTIWQAWLLSSTVDGVFLEGLARAQVMDWLRLILVIIAGRAALAWVNEVSANAVAVQVKTRLRERLFAHIQALGPAYTRGERTGDLTTAAVEGIEALDTYFSQYLPQLVITALIPISILIFIFPLDLLSGMILLITAPLIPFFMILIGKGAEIVTERQYQTLSRLSSHFLDSLQGLTTLKIFGQSKAHARSIARASEHFRNRTMTVLRVTFLSALVLELLTTLSTAVIAVEIGLRLLYARMEFREAFFLLILAPEFYLPLRMLGARFHAGMAGTSAARRIFEILDLPVRTTDNRPQSVGYRPSSIVLKNVSFIYPGETTPALQNINLQIEAGQHMALVGPSGAGKSTLVNLLLGFIQPSSGQILTKPLSGTTDQPIYHLPFTNSIAWVPQKPYLFHDTISANIRLSNPEATGEQVIAAAQAAHLHKFIESLPDKYETVIGEGGGRLSGGQAQRLALARAFLMDAPILILDEPTSSLDPETESLLEESARQLMRGKTVITIAHRLNTVFQADKIVVLEKGRIVEQGTHSELVAKNGSYAKLVNATRSMNGNWEFLGDIVKQGNGNLPQITKLQSPIPSLRLPIPTSASPILPRLLSFLNGSWNWVTLSVLLGTLTIGANVALMGASAWLISTAALHPSVAALQVAIVGVRFFGISRGVFRYLERLVSHDVTFRLLSRLRVWFYERLEPLAPARLMDYRAGDLLARIIGDVETLENFYVRIVSPALVALLTALGVSIFLASFYPLLALVLVGFFLGIGLFLPLLSQLLSRETGKALVSLRSDLHTRLIDGIQGLPEILVYGRATDRLALISQTGRAYGLAQRRMARISGFQSALGTLLTNLGMWTVLFLSIPLVSDGRLDGVMLGTLTLLTLASFEAVTPLPLAAQMWESVKASAGRLFEIVDAKPAVRETRDLRLETGKSEPISHLQFSSLSFSYPNQVCPALQDISFELEPGKNLAIVGPSGAGKSTIVSLLLRFWEYSSGEIRLGGESLHGLEQDEVRGRCAVVSQSSYFFNASLRENFRLARPSASQAEIEQAARQAQMHGFIHGLPRGYDTLIGEQGLRLSGGERQRLAIARALLKEAPVLILDEPTANLDPLTEKQVLETLFNVMKGRTSLLITHRLVGLENVDKILVMEAGQIVERGTQDELLARDGTFRRLWEMQNRILIN